MALAVLFGIYFAFSVPPVVAVGDNVSVYYTGTFPNGTIFDSNVGRQPLQFTAGSRQLIRGFDQAVVGMKLDQTKNITLTPDQAYGQYNASLIVSIPRSTFKNQTPTLGMTVVQVSGNLQRRGLIILLNATNVTVNFNPPLAGQTLIFQIKVVQIQKRVA